MGTKLFNQIIFGPVQSRRLGLSLGVNLLPIDNKLCSFECIYCECGWSKNGAKANFNVREDVYKALESSLEKVEPDTITFAGNGEPTFHPDFEAIIEDTITLRDKLCPSAKVSVLTNGTRMGVESVRCALLRVDNNIVKLDSVREEIIRQINNPCEDYTVAEKLGQMKSFNGHIIIQTMFLRGIGIDNTSESDIAPWLEAIKEISPNRVMIYTISRDTPVGGLENVPVEDMEQIAERVRASGIDCSVSG